MPVPWAELITTAGALGSTALSSYLASQKGDPEDRGRVKTVKWKKGKPPWAQEVGRDIIEGFPSYEDVYGVYADTYLPWAMQAADYLTGKYGDLISQGEDMLELFRPGGQGISRAEDLIRRRAGQQFMTGIRALEEVGGKSYGSRIDTARGLAGQYGTALSDAAVKAYQLAMNQQMGWTEALNQLYGQKAEASGMPSQAMVQMLESLMGAGTARAGAWQSIMGVQPTSQYIPTQRMPEPWQQALSDLFGAGAYMGGQAVSNYITPSPAQDPGINIAATPYAYTGNYRPDYAYVQ